MAEAITKEQFDAYIAQTGEQAPFTSPAYDAATDGEITYVVDHNGDLVVECATSKRFRKYPWPAQSV